MHQDFSGSRVQVDVDICGKCGKSHEAPLLGLHASKWPWKCGFSFTFPTLLCRTLLTIIVPWIQASVSLSISPSLQHCLRRVSVKNMAAPQLLRQHSAIFQCILLPTIGHAVTTDAKRRVRLYKVHLGSQHSAATALGSQLWKENILAVRMDDFYACH